MLPTTDAPFPQFFDRDGLPLDEGSIYYGAVNANPVTSQIQVYWDAAGTQPAAQPIRTLNGYPVHFGTPSNVFTGQSYSVSVYSKSGELIYTEPDSTEYSLRIFKLTDAGAVSRPLLEKVADTINAKDFGAVGDGVVDDTASLQAAINACISRGTELNLSRGTYRHSGLTVNGALTIIGEGQDLTTLLCTNLSGTHIAVDTQLSFRVAGIHFRSSGAVTGGYAINLTSSTPGTANQHSVISDCTFTEQFICINTQSAYLWKIKGCTFNLYQTAGVWVQNDFNGDAGDSTIYGGCVFAGRPTVDSVGVFQISSGGLKITGNKFVQGGYGYLMQLAHGVATGCLLINGNSLENMLVAGIQMNRVVGGPTDMSMSDVAIVGNEFLGTATGIPINLNDLDNAWLNGVVITGNMIDVMHAGMPPYGILVNGAYGFTITGNQLLGSAGGTAGIGIGVGARNGSIGLNSLTDFTLPISNASASTYIAKKVYQTVITGIVCNAPYGPLALFSGFQAVVFPVGLFLQSPVVTATAVSGTSAVSVLVNAVNGTGCNVVPIAGTNGSLVTVHIRAEADY